jgi:hypothetical protein
VLDRLLEYSIFVRHEPTVHPSERLPRGTGTGTYFLEFAFYALG